MYNVDIIESYSLEILLHILPGFFCCCCCFVMLRILCILVQISLDMTCHSLCEKEIMVIRIMGNRNADRTCVFTEKLWNKYCYI